MLTLCRFCYINHLLQMSDDQIAKLENLVGVLMSPDDKLRNEAERFFNGELATNPNNMVFGLVKLVRQSKIDPVRFFCRLLFTCPRVCACFLTVLCTGAQLVCGCAARAVGQQRTDSVRRAQGRAPGGRQEGGSCVVLYFGCRL